MSTTIIEEVMVDVSVYRSKRDGRVCIEIDTAEGSDERIRVNLNDALLYDGDPEKDDSPIALLDRIRNLIVDTDESGGTLLTIHAMIDGLLGES